jgi:hypothetical protein
MHKTQKYMYKYKHTYVFIGVIAQSLCLPYNGQLCVCVCAVCLLPACAVCVAPCGWRMGARESGGGFGAHG